MLYQVPPRTKLNHEVGGAIHTSEVAVNGRSASPWAAAGTAAARVRSSKVYGLRSKGILLAKEGNGDLSEVSGEHHKAWRMCYMRCEHLFTPLAVAIIPVSPEGELPPRGHPRVHWRLRVVSRLPVDLKLVWVWWTPVSRPSPNLQTSTAMKAGKAPSDSA